MKKDNRISFIMSLALLCMAFTANAQNVTIKAVKQPAATVFRSLMEQTGKNFVYSSELLKDMKVTVKAKRKPLRYVLAEMFSYTSVEYKIKGKNVILKRRLPEPKNDKDINEHDQYINVASLGMDKNG